MTVKQSLAQGVRDKLPHFPFPMKFNFALRRVDVYVDFARIALQKQTADRITAFHQRGVIAFHQGVVESAIINRAAVDKKMLFLAG